MTEPTSDSELFTGPGKPRQGSMDTEEFLIGLVQAHYPRKPYCLVQDWTIFHVEMTEEELSKIHAANHLPLFVFAHKVVEDSRGRFLPGDWVRSSMCVLFTDDVMFETKSTVYVLMGPGHEQTASLKTIFSFF